MQELLNKTITEVFIDKNLQAYLLVKTTEGDFLYEAVGDCCSKSYFAEILGVGNVLNEKVVEVEDIELGVGDPKDGEDHVQVYGIKLKTQNNGSMLVIFRNDSNGYYGGSLERILKIKGDDIVKMDKILQDYRAD